MFASTGRHGARALAIVVGLALAACGGSTKPHAGGGVCGARNASSYLANARVAFVGIMMPGPTLRVGSRDVLLSPARVHVIHYLKGNGPATVTIVTGVSRRDGENVANEDGIEPQVGQYWKVFTSSNQMPYETSICEGTAPVAGSA